MEAATVDPKHRDQRADVTIGTDWTVCAGAQAGFTLVEMLVVLTILAMVAVLSGPVLGRISDGRAMDAFEESLRGQLTLTRAAAIRTSRATSVLLDVPGRAVRSDAGLPVLPLPVGLSADLATQRSGRASEGLIRFLPDGRSSGGTIRLERAGVTRRIIVERLTGAVMRDARGDAS